MAGVTESILEKAALSWFESLGYTILHGPDIDPDAPHAERASYEEVTLKNRLLSALSRINPNTPYTVLDEVIRKISLPQSPSLMENNRRFHRYLVEGVPVEYQSGGRTIYDQVWLIDFSHPEQNDWLAVNQFTVIENRHNRRPDVVVFINGLPLAVIELKNPADITATVKDAFNQLQTYKAELPAFFTCNEVLVISDGLEARAGTITSNW